MSDDTSPTPADGHRPTAHPPLPPIPPLPPHQATAPAPQPPSYPAAPPSPPAQAYPGAAPSFPPAPQPQTYSGAVQPYGAVAPQSPYGNPASGQPGPGYPTYAAPAYPAPRPVSGLAITSLICGIAGVVLFWALVPLLASIVAVITGHMALRQMKANPAIGGRGMAVAGLIMGYVMVAVLVIGIVMTVIGFLFFGAFTLPFLFST